MTIQKRKQVSNKVKNTSSAKIVRSFDIAKIIIELLEFEQEEIKNAIELIKREGYEQIDKQLDDLLHSILTTSTDNASNSRTSLDNNTLKQEMKTKDFKKNNLISEVQHQLKHKQILQEDQEILDLILKITKQKISSSNRSKLITSLINLLHELDYTNINKIVNELRQNYDSTKSGYQQLSEYIIEGDSSNSKLNTSDKYEDSGDDTKSLSLDVNTDNNAEQHELSLNIKSDSKEEKDELPT